MKNIFENYESVKLEIFQPDYANFIIVFLFFLIITVTINKNKDNESENCLLSLSHTNQLRGIAIFFVILGHLWVHVSKTGAKIILSGDAVSLFLIISGFGLVMSTRNGSIYFKDFFFKRIKRVMLPYWIVTIFVLILDYFILKRTLQFRSLMMTFLGINTSIELEHLDYVRWFVTFILLWYLLFYAFFLKYKTKYSLILLFIIAFNLQLLNYYVLHLSWYHFFSFPVGCYLAFYHKKILTYYKEYKLMFIFLAISGMTYVLMYKFFMGDENIHSIVVETIPNIILVYVSEGNGLIMSISCLILLSQVIERGYSSKILLFLGKYSYELFLLHGIFLIKYNPIIKGHMAFDILIQFSTFFLFITGISVLIHKIHTSMYEIK